MNPDQLHDIVNSVPGLHNNPATLSRVTLTLNDIYFLLITNNSF